MLMYGGVMVLGIKFTVKAHKVGWVRWLQSNNFFGQKLKASLNLVKENNDI